MKNWLEIIIIAFAIAIAFMMCHGCYKSTVLNMEYQKKYGAQEKPLKF